MDNRGVLEVDEVGNGASWAILAQDFDAKLARKARAGRDSVRPQKREVPPAPSPERKNLIDFEERI